MSSLLAPNIYRFRCKVNATTEIQSELVNERWMLGGTSSRKSTFGMAADFADNRPIVGTELEQRLGQSKGFHARPGSRLNDAKETT
jgi:hypothetical protein